MTYACPSPRSRPSARRWADRLLPAVLVALALPADASALPGETARLSASPLGVEADGASSPSFISGDGRWVAFSSFADNLLPADPDRFSDVYLVDRQTRDLSLVSRSTTGEKGNGTSSADGITRDGRFVLFRSDASNLVPGDTNARNPQGAPMGDLFLRDLQTGVTERVNVSSSGAQTNNYTWEGAVSDDGRFVAFRSEATNLVANDRNGDADVFLRDRLDHTTTRVSVNAQGGELNGPSFNAEISGDGRYIAYSTGAGNALRSDRNGAADDVFVYDRVTARTELVSVSSAGVQGDSRSIDPELSADGRFVAFHSAASNLVPGDTPLTNDMFVRDRLAGTTERVSVSSTGTTDAGNMSGTYHGISRDGRFVAFATQKKLVPEDSNGSITDVYVRDRLRATTIRASVSTTSAEGNGPSYWPSISDDGRLVTFGSDATNLVAGDASDRSDVFLRELPDPGAAPPA